VQGNFGYALKNPMDIPGNQKKARTCNKQGIHIDAFDTNFQ